MHSKIVFVKVESSVINVEPKQRDTFHLVIECYLRNKTYETVFYRGNKTWVRVRCVLRASRCQGYCRTVEQNISRCNINRSWQCLTHTQSRVMITFFKTLVFTAFRTWLWLLVQFDLHIGDDIMYSARKTIPIEYTCF